MASAFPVKQVPVPGWGPGPVSTGPAPAVFPCPRDYPPAFSRPIIEPIIELCRALY